MLVSKEILNMHRKRIFTAVIALLFCASPEARTDQSTSSSLRAGPTTIDIRAFPIEGQTEGLEPQIFDFRYAPRRWQACIGLLARNRQNNNKISAGPFFL